MRFLGGSWGALLAAGQHAQRRVGRPLGGGWDMGTALWRAGAIFCMQPVPRSPPLCPSLDWRSRPAPPPPKLAALVAVHSDSWLLSLAFFKGARFTREQR